MHQDSRTSPSSADEENEEEANEAKIKAIVSHVFRIGGVSVTELGTVPPAES
jgi:hypothetical protein